MYRRAGYEVAVVTVGWLLHRVWNRECEIDATKCCCRRLCSVSMYHDRVGEFWYKLQLSADPPAPTTLPPMECELGRWMRHDIVLDVPTADLIRLEPVLSDSTCFKLEYSSSSPLEVTARRPLVVPLIFVPSMIGPGDQRATIVFRSRQVRHGVPESSRKSDDDKLVV